MSHSYNRTLADLKVVRRVAVEDKKRKPLKNKTVSSQCAAGRHANCAVRTCRCSAARCECRFNPQETK